MYIFKYPLRMIPGLDEAKIISFHQSLPEVFPAGQDHALPRKYETDAPARPNHFQSALQHQLGQFKVGSSSKGEPTLEVLLKFSTVLTLGLFVSCLQRVQCTEL